jgi:hypothetical protein
MSQPDLTGGVSDSSAEFTLAKEKRKLAMYFLVYCASINDIAKFNFLPSHTPKPWKSAKRFAYVCDSLLPLEMKPHGVT